jgi:hypothetical protein
MDILKCGMVYCDSSSTVPLLRDDCIFHQKIPTERGKGFHYITIFDRDSASNNIFGRNILAQNIAM